MGFRYVLEISKFSSLFLSLLFLRECLLFLIKGINSPLKWINSIQFVLEILNVKIVHYNDFLITCSARP